MTKKNSDVSNQFLRLWAFLISEFWQKEFSNIVKKKNFVFWNRRMFSDSNWIKNKNTYSNRHEAGKTDFSFKRKWIFADFFFHGTFSDSIAHFDPCNGFQAKKKSQIPHLFSFWFFQDWILNFFTSSILQLYFFYKQIKSASHKVYK